MTETAVQAWLPTFEETAQRSGILPAQWYEGAIARGIVTSARAIDPERQVQPASIDLRLGATAYRVSASFLPGRTTRVAEKLAWLASETIDLKDGAVLKRDQVYIVQLQESVNLKKRMSAVANPKSSTGRLDVFARVITDGCSEFDSVAEQYEGPLWVEIAPRSFDVIVREGSRLVQLRVRSGVPRPSERQLRALHENVRIVGEEDEPDITRRGVAITVDVMGDEVSKLIGYKAKRAGEAIDVDRINAYDPSAFWEPVYRPESGGIVLQPDDFHILASKATVAVPEDHAADLIAYDTLVGEFRVHYAGFFDPGFGYAQTGRRGARAVLEVRSHEVPFMLEDGQTVGRLAFERLTERTAKPYGSDIGSSYQYQGLALSKQFRR